MPIVEVELQYDVASVPEVQKPYVLPALHAILSEKRNPHKDELGEAWTTLLNLGFAENGKLYVDAHTLLEALTWTSFDDSMNRAGQY